MEHDLLVKVLYSQSRGSVFETTGWLQGWLSSKDDSAFYLSEVDKMSNKSSGNLVVKSKLSPRSGSGLEAVEPHS